jgi:hypothetical protein
MLARYYVTGWSNRFSNWIAEHLEAKNMVMAKERFVTKYPTLKRIKAYKLRGEA